MPTTELDGAKVFIDSTVLTKAEALKPPYLSRTAWVNQLIEQAIHRFADHSAYAAND
jgi:hypothetical protein